METSEVIGVLIYLVVLTSIVPVLGSYMASVFKGEKHFLKSFLEPSEKFIYRVIHCDGSEMDWKKYTINLLVFNTAGFIFLFIIQLVQQYLPLNPQHLTAVKPHLAFNTAVSFVTNTNWQSYAGETTYSYFVQMLGLTVQNFLSAATGLSVFVALVRGIVGREVETIGNFWVDCTRSILYILLPLSIILSLILAGQGVVQTLKGYAHITTIEGARQIIPLGPVASQVAIKQIGTNGGGFFSANSAHPFENPTPLTNFLEMIAILAIPAALTYTYGKLTGFRRQGWTIFMVMMLLLVTGLVVSLVSEHTVLSKGLTVNMEGKETRFGVTTSVLWSVITTSASNGSVNAMIDSMTPLSGMIAMVNIMLGELVFGGVGAGMYGILMFVILTVFIAGLMVGRTPEFFGKKIESFEVRMAILAVLAPNFVILVFSAIATISSPGISSLGNGGPHGLSEILYCFSSAAGNNGSALAGLNANTIFYNVMTGTGMLIGRYLIIVPALAIAGSMVKKKSTPVSSGTFRTDTFLFGVLLVAVILIVGGLTFFPAISLGPLAEHLLMIR